MEYRLWNYVKLVWQSIAKFFFSFFRNSRRELWTIFTRSTNNSQENKTEEFMGMSITTKQNKIKDWF